LAQDPLSHVTMAFAGSKGDISQITRCGFTGSAFNDEIADFHEKLR
jgi:hypothetical protein